MYESLAAATTCVKRLQDYSDMFALSPVARCASDTVLCSRVGSVLQQELDSLRLAFLCGNVQRSQPA